jgi:hypothetical protein
MQRFMHALRARLPLPLQRRLHVPMLAIVRPFVESDGYAVGEGSC